MLARFPSAVPRTLLPVVMSANLVSSRFIDGEQSALTMFDTPPKSTKL
jgi:hypothetical protein